VDMLVQRVHPKIGPSYKSSSIEYPSQALTSNMSIDCCCLTGELSTSTQSLTLHRMHPANGSSSGL